LLDTDDDLPADQYVYDARRLLADVAAGIEDAGSPTRRTRRYRI
jgi:hypothetical protein